MDKKLRKTDEDIKALVMSLRFIDDVLFEKYAEDAMACEELLQTVLENPKLRVKPETLVAQKVVENIAKRSVRLDAYVEGEEDIVYNIEIQRADNCNHVKRVRFNGSCITVNCSEPGDTFEDVQNVCIIYISEFDMFGAGHTIYHAETVVQETGKNVNDGMQAIYVNTAVDDGTKISRLMQHFKETDFEDAEFPYSSNRIHELKHNAKEVEKVCNKVEEFTREREIITAIEAWQDVGLSKEDIIPRVAKKFNLDEETAMEYYEEVALQPV
jgi:predicted transposase/invertase (TIGR01784 family)